MPHPPVIDGLEFARTGSKLEGTWPVAGFARLRDSLYAGVGAIRYAIEGIAREQGYPALRVMIGGELQLVCQRCLGALGFPLSIAVFLELAVTQAEVDAVPVEPDGPERIVAGREMRVHDLIEDELLLALPIAPRHESCQGKAAGAAREMQSPFAGLRGILKH